MFIRNYFISVKIKVSKIAIIGENDLKENKITIKDMVSGNQELVDIDNKFKFKPVLIF